MPQNGNGAYHERPVRLSINTSTASSSGSRPKGERRTSAVQILDIIREDTGALDVERTDTTIDRPTIPVRAEGTVVRWMFVAFYLSIAESA